MREIRTSGSVGAPGGNPPGATRQAEAEPEPEPEAEPEPEPEPDYVAADLSSEFLRPWSGG